MKNKNTFYFRTKANWVADRCPSCEPDYISYNRDGSVSSMYWYTPDGVYRYSNHWSVIYGPTQNKKMGLISCGKVASCYWTIRTSTATTRWICGYCPWNKFSNNF